MVRKDLAPGAVAPFFRLTTIVFAAGVLSRFDLFIEAIPPAAHVALLWASFPLLLVAGALEARVDHGPQLPDVPLWMTITSRPIRYTFALAPTYLGIVALQAFEISLGVVDPRAPEVWPPLGRLAWFLGFSFGMSFANFMVATAALIPALRRIAALFSRLPWALGVGLLTALGVGLGAGAVEVLARRAEVVAWVGAVVDSVWQRQ
ncbi:MAG TPA: hypothetical protein VIK91_18330 [Nannocystis sp.]